MQLKIQLFCVLSIAVCVSVNLEGADSAPAEATAPNAVEKRESSNAAVATDSEDTLRDVRRIRFDNRRKKYYTNRRLYSRRRPVSHSSQSSSEGTSSSESVSDSDERTGRRNKSPARHHIHRKIQRKMGRKMATKLAQNSEYAYIPVRREDLMKLLQVQDPFSKPASTAGSAKLSFSSLLSSPSDNIITINTDNLRSESPDSENRPELSHQSAGSENNEPVVNNNGTAIQIIVP